MAYASRLLSKSKQLQGSLVTFQQHQAIPVRAFANEAARPSYKGDEMLKNVFKDIKTKFDTAVEILRKEKITLAPEDPAAVQQYANVMKTIRQKAGMLSESQRIQFEIEVETKDIPDARAYLSKLKEIRIRKGLTDELGGEAMMFEALEKVEKEIKKPLMRDNKKGMDLLVAEFDIGNKKLGIRKEDLPKYEEKLELSMAKAQLEELKSDAIEAMESQKKKEEFQDEEMPDVKSLDIRNFL